MVLLEIQDINAFADIFTLISCLYLFYKWRKKNSDFGFLFLILGLVFANSSLLNITHTSGYTNDILRLFLSASFTISLAYISTLMMKDCKRLNIVFLLYLIFPVLVFSTDNPIIALKFFRIIGDLILLPYFAILFTLGHREIKIFSFIGICTIFIRAMFNGIILIDPMTEANLPWYVTKLLLMSMFVLLAHFSVHGSKNIIDQKNPKKRTVIR